jgi:uncharacterized protein (DUF2141 family)
MKNSIFISLLILFSLTSYAQMGEITVTVTEIENKNGNIVIGLYNNDSDFPTVGKEYKGAHVKPSESEKLTYTFNNIPAGKYAVAVWHDENKNKKTDKNFLGLPKEKYGFSKNVYGTFGPPDFDEVSFKVDNGENVKLTINLK